MYLLLIRKEYLCSSTFLKGAKGGHLSLISTSRSLPEREGDEVRLFVGQNYWPLAARGQLLDICPDLDIHGTISDVLTFLLDISQLTKMLQNHTTIF